MLSSAPVDPIVADLDGRHAAAIAAPSPQPLSPSERDVIARIVDAAPPLKPAAAARLSALLRGAR